MDVLANAQHVLLLIISLSLCNLGHALVPKKASHCQLFPSSPECVITQSDIDYMADNMVVRVKTVDNLNEEGRYRIGLQLHNSGNRTIKGQNWELYFYNFYMVEPEKLKQGSKAVFFDKEYLIKITHISGGLFKLEPLPGFQSIRPGQKRSLEFGAQYWSAAVSDYQPNWYITSRDLQPRVIASTTENYSGPEQYIIRDDLNPQFVDDFATARQWKRYRTDEMNPFTPQDRYARYKLEDEESFERNVVPTPKSVIQEPYASLDLSNGMWSIVADPLLDNEARTLSEKLEIPIASSSSMNRSTHIIELKLDPTLPITKEGYHLETRPLAQTILIKGTMPTGVFYGVQTLLGFVDEENDVMKIRGLDIMDDPRFQHRGLHVDIARNFVPKSDLIRVIELMAMYKLNKLHLSLTNDESWRIEIPTVPELTEIGSKICHDLEEKECLLPQIGSGPYSNSSSIRPEYLTLTDYQDLVRHAANHHIEIIPEINSPGHAYAAVTALERRYHNLMPGEPVAAKAYRVKDPDDLSEYLSFQNFRNNAMNPCMDSTYAFIELVITTLQEAHREAGVPLRTYHFGGDEVAKNAWLNSTACNHGNKHKDWTYYFNQRVADKTERHGLALAGYDDAFMDKDGTPYPRTGFSNAGVIAQFWNSVAGWGNVNRAYDLANAGYKVVLSPATHLYLDHSYEPDPEERGLYWASRYIDTKKIFEFMADDLYKNLLTRRSGEVMREEEMCGATGRKCPTLLQPENIIGIEGQLWGELIRSRAHMDNMLFPRLLALAERAWHKADWEYIKNPAARDRAMGRDWNKFAKNLGYNELKRLDEMGVRYRLTPPGAMVKGGRIYTITEYPGQLVEFSSGNRKKWRPVPTNWSLGGGNNEILLRTREGHIKTNADTLGEIMEFSIDKGKTWRLVPKSWPIASYNPIMLRTRSRDRKRTSRGVEFDPRGELFIPSQKDVIYMAKNLHVTYTVLDNLVDTNKTFLLWITLENRGAITINYGNWSVYFYSIRLLQPEYFPYENGYLLHDCGLWLHHVGGTLYRLEPDFDKFSLRTGQRTSCLIRGKYWQVSRTDVMPNWYIAAEGMKPYTIENTKGEDLTFVRPFNSPNKWKRFPNDQYNPYPPMTRYEINKDVIDLGQGSKPVIPTPNLYKLLPADRDILLTEQNWVILASSEFPLASVRLAALLSLPIVDVDPQDGSKTIQFIRTMSPLMSRENEAKRDGYVISSSNEGIQIEAREKAGAFYAVQTLHSLSRKQRSEQVNGVSGPRFILPAIIINDEPRYSYRGLHLDVARNFKTKEEVMRLLDLMSRYKLNKLHLLLTDNEGWRLEIPGLPELTQVGSRRCHDEQCLLPQLGSGPEATYPGSGFYTVNDYKDILRHARDRHIEIIPEVNTPFHSHAAIKSMEARYKRLMKGLFEYEAERFLLSEVDDNSTSSVPKQPFSDNIVNPCLTSTYIFIRHVMREIKKMHSDIQPLRIYHVGGPGGDKFHISMWNSSKACQMALQADPTNMKVTDLRLYFIQRIGEMAAEEEIDLGMWENALMSDGKPLPRSILPSNPRKVYAFIADNVWDRNVADSAHKLANADYKVVLAHATHLFLDHPYEPDPEERGFYWGSRATNTRKVFGYMPEHIIWNADVTTAGVPISPNEVCNQSKCVSLQKPENVEGIQGNIWSETIRNQDQLDYMSTPRILALAERAWHHAAWEDEPDDLLRSRARDREWFQFANTLGYRELERLDDLGYKYRIPPPGATVKGNMLYINTAFPGLKVEYSVDNQRTWTVADGPIDIGRSLLIYLRTKSADGNRNSRIVSLAPAMARVYHPFWQIPFFQKYLMYLY